MPLYAIFEGSTSSGPDDWIFTGEQFDDPAEAAAMCKMRNAAFKRTDSDIRARVKAIPTDAESDWVARERLRFETGHYTPCPWDIPVNGKAPSSRWKGKFPYHFPHMSKKTPGNVAYTPNPIYGHRDRKIICSAGRYLHLAYSAIPDREFRKWCIAANPASEKEFHIATTREDIKHVYETGPDSCMAHKARWFASDPIHPCEAYASGDFGVAYLERSGKITARAVVTLKKPLWWFRIYGDTGRLEPHLYAHGYSLYDRRWKELQGRRLLAIRHPNYRDVFSIPYLDMGTGLVARRKYLRFHPEGELYGSTMGYSGENVMRCAYCEGFAYAGEFLYDGMSYCERCFKEHFHVCAVCDRGIMKSHAVRDGDRYLHRTCQAPEMDERPDLRMRMADTTLIMNASRFYDNDTVWIIDEGEGE